MGMTLNWEPSAGLLEPNTVSVTFTIFVTCTVFDHAGCRMYTCNVCVCNDLCVKWSLMHLDGSEWQVCMCIVVKLEEQVRTGDKKYTGG